MEKSTRTANTFKNIFISLVMYGISYIAVFIGRTFFIHILGNDYLSVAGLFTNVITLVSFSELGLGAASVYCLYRPIAENDYAKIRGLLDVFGRIYKIVAFATVAIGIVLIPFLPFMVDMKEMAFKNIYLSSVYVLFIINTAVSYIFVQKKLFLTANQKNYIVNIIQQIANILQLVFQTIFLIVTRNFIGYLIIQIIFTISTNIFISLYVKKKYQFILSKEPRYVLKNEEKKEIGQNIASIFFYKIGAVILNGTDNIIISVVLKTALIGVCSNYTLVINAINSVAMQCFNGIGASIGNHIIDSEKDEQEKVFRELDFFCVSVFSFCSVCLAVLLNRLIVVWLGKNYVLPQLTVLSLVCAFYVTGANQIPSLYRTSFGLFKEARFYPLAASLANIVLSVLLAKLIGLSGVFWATVIVKIVFFTIVDCRLTYKRGFNMKPHKYYVTYCYRLVVLIVSYEVVSAILQMIKVDGVEGLLIHSVCCAFITGCCLFIAYSWTIEFRLMTKRIKGFFWKYGM